MTSATCTGVGPPARQLLWRLVVVVAVVLLLLPPPHRSSRNYYSSTHLRDWLPVERWHLLPALCRLYCGKRPRLPVEHGRLYHNKRPPVDLLPLLCRLCHKRLPVDLPALCCLYHKRLPVHLLYGLCRLCGLYCYSHRRLPVDLL